MLTNSLFCKLARLVWFLSHLHIRTMGLRKDWKLGKLSVKSCHIPFTYRNRKQASMLMWPRNLPFNNFWVYQLVFQNQPSSASTSTLPLLYLHVLKLFSSPSSSCWCVLPCWFVGCHIDISDFFSRIHCVLSDTWPGPLTANSCSLVKLSHWIAHSVMEKFWNQIVAHIRRFQM